MRRLKGGFAETRLHLHRSFHELQHLSAVPNRIAIITILKAGFLWSGRAGAGLVVARLPDGTWSAPSAIATAGAGFGAQIGAQLTDCVFILNNEAAVKAFSHGGNVTLGGNLSVCAGPKGRSAEAAGGKSYVPSLLGLGVGGEYDGGKPVSINILRPHHTPPPQPS